MQNFSTNPVNIFKALVDHRGLVAELTKRDVLGRYRGSLLGIAWGFINPVLMLAIYTFVFSMVFNARWGAGSTSKTEFAMVLFAGLIVFNFLAECVGRAPNLIAGHANYVKKVVFPLDVLGWVVVLAAAFHALISFFVWILGYSLLIGGLNHTILYLPIVIIPIVLFVLGLTWGLSALGVYFKDLNQIIGMVLTVLMFMSPIFYPITAVPEELRTIFQLNPIALMVDQFRDLSYWGRIPDGWKLIVLWGQGLLVLTAGFAFFQKTRKGFADVL
jgi:lipopolysaccharide transport system permease protein